MRPDQDTQETQNLPPVNPVETPRREEVAAARGVGGFLSRLAERGRSFASGIAAALGGDGDDRPQAGDAAGDSQREDPTPRLNVLHSIAERLRGAADGFVTAKLDEIEARVDAKLDDIERRIEEKLRTLHEHLQEIRDREVRHRLRLLKITLIFTALVAVLSLGYKCVDRFWLQ